MEWLASKMAEWLPLGEKIEMEETPQKAMCATRHFAMLQARTLAKDSVLHSAVSYQARTPDIKVVYAMAEDVFLVHRRLHDFYFPILLDIIQKQRSRETTQSSTPSDGSDYVDLTNLTPEWDERELNWVTLLEKHVTGHDNMFMPSEWVIYTRESSRFARYFGSIFGGDPTFDYKSDKNSFGSIGGKHVPFHVAAFFCGTDPAFLELTTPDTSATLSTPVPHAVFDVGSLSSRAPSVSGKNPMMIQNDWIVLPSWAYSLRRRSSLSAEPWENMTWLTAARTIQLVEQQAIRLAKLDQDADVVKDKTECYYAADSMSTFMNGLVATSRDPAHSMSQQ